MNEKELGDALLKWASSAGPEANPDEMVQRVLNRDQKRVRRLAMVTAALWFVAVAGIPLFFTLFTVFILPKVNVVLREMITHELGFSPQRLAEVSHSMLVATATLGIVLVTGSVFVLLLAAWATVALVFASRRQTLKQVNANLLKIEEQLRRSRQ